MQFKNRDPKPSAVYHIILAAAVAAVFCLIFTQSVFAAFPTDWQFRKSHLITSAAGAGTDYQVRITVNYGAGTDSGETVYLDGNCRTDFGDIRFVSSDGVTELDYWMETGSLFTGVSATFWVKVADDLGAADQTIYIYYGNPAETTTSDGETAFIFFDDFDSGLTKWTVEKTLDSGFIAIQPGNFLRCGGGQTSGTYGHTSIGSSLTYNSFTDGAIEVRLKGSTDNLAEIAYRGDFGANTGYKGRFDGRSNNESPHMRPPYFTWSAFGTAVPRFGIDTDTWYRGTVSVTSSGGSYTHRIFRNDVLMSSTTDTTYAGPGEIALQNHYGSYSDYDWVAVRKFVYPEPADDVWGTEDPLAADVYSTKSVAIHTDTDASQTITSGDILQYNVKIYNTGNVAALGATFTDPLPGDVTYAGSETATSGSVSYNAGLNQIEWTGDIAVGALIVITFDVSVDYLPGPLPLPDGTVVSNQGTISFDSDNDGANDTAVLTDGNPDTAGIQTTDFTIGAAAHGLGTKIAVDLDLDGDGILEPGDTVEYTIEIINNSGFTAAAPLEFVDVIPDNTTYVAGSATCVPDVNPVPYPDNPIVISFTDPTLSITGIDIGGAAPDNVITITFRVLLDNPFPDGVTEISNQADVHYDSNSDGTNDTWQSTDGDPGTPGNQPTVSAVTVGTISGTVFDDLDGDGTQDAGEPGMSGVDVNVYDGFINLLYPTDLYGGYIFTGLPSGTYTVEETVPAYYFATTPNPVITPLAAGGSEVINFGNQANGNADLMVVKHCTTVAANGTNQLVFVITVTNEGPDDATNVVLTDDLTSLTGLSNATCTVDNVLPASPWSGSYNFGTVNNSISHTVRIYADVSETFTPAENTATVVSDIFDPATGDNTSSCTNQPCPRARRAMQFNPAVNASVTVASAPSLELTTSGTVEAWIFVDEFQANSELIGKGDADETFDTGLCGGDPGDEFEGGTAQNIGFALYETDGTQHLVIADTFALNARQWYHIACTWTGTAPGTIDMTIYINGIEKAFHSAAFTNAVRGNTEDLAIGFNHFVGGRFLGTMDEVRIWDTARAQARIRDTMCHKMTNAEPDYTDLMGNWRFDEQCGTVCNDVSAYGNIGITNAERVCSAAPIGDDSAHDYTGSAGPEYQILNFASDLGDNITVTEDGGDWDPSLDSCLHVYRVDDGPENYGQPQLWKSLGLNPHYWGVFKSGGTDPTYEVVYTYTGYPFTSEETIELAFRNSNCESWKGANAEQDKLNDTFTQSGFSGTEFILGADVDPRNTIQYDPTNNTYVGVSDEASLRLTSEGTLEAWVYASTVQAAGIIDKVFASGLNLDGYSLTMNGSGNILFTLYNGLSSPTVTSSTSLSAGIWYHITATWNGSNAENLYINGVLDNSGSAGATAGNSTGSDLLIGSDTANYFDGRIDEVRIWDEFRSQADIQTYMCRKVDSRDPNLVGYWRFDEETTSPYSNDFGTVPYNFASMYGFATAGDIISGRICSEAPIGDASDYAYGSPASATVSHPDGDFFFATNYAGNWGSSFSGLHVYRVDGPPVYPPHIAGPLPYNAYVTPNGLTPPTGWSSVDYYRYWGVFLTDWSTASQPQFQAVYNYGTPGVSGNPSAPYDETEIALARRDSYCDTTWADAGATLNTTTNTLTKLWDTQNSPSKTYTEYILAGKDQPLAIALASFYAEFDRENECIRITWETATEIDTLGFQLWRSDTREGPYSLIPGSFTASMAVSGATGATYSFSDCDADLETYMTFYYKLEEIDLDASRKNPFYGPIGPVTESISASQFNKATPSANSGGGCFIGALE